MAHDVFISHSGKDKRIADAVCATLEKGGTRCWIAPRDIIPGTQWGEAIIDAISNCKVMVLVFSANANESQQIVREVERAVNKGIPVIPFRIEDVDPNKSLEYYISAPHWLDALTPPLEKHLEQLNSTIKLLLEKLDVSAPEPETFRDEEANPVVVEEKTGESGAGAGAADFETIRPFGEEKSSDGQPSGVGFGAKLAGIIAAVLILAGIGYYVFPWDGGEDIDNPVNTPPLYTNPPDNTSTKNTSVVTEVDEGGEWGALAVAPNGTWGFATRRLTKDGAEKAALDTCKEYSPDCELKSSFTNCIVYARAEDGSWGWATDATVRAAKPAAKETCEQYTTQQCDAYVELCADNSVRRVNVWAAIATSSNGKYGKSWNYPSRQEAETAALNECDKYGPDCEMRISFENCGAVARSIDGALGWAHYDNMDDAVNGAYEECRSRSDKECKLLTKLCSDGSQSE